MSYDLVIVGTGLGGYACAQRAARLGLKVAVVERRLAKPRLGCIGSSTLLYGTDMPEPAAPSAAQEKAPLSKPKPDLMALFGLTAQGRVKPAALKDHQIRRYIGVGEIVAPGTVKVKAEDGTTLTLQTQAILIAAGADFATLPGVEIDERRVVTPTGALALETPPGKLLVVGADYVALDLASVLGRLGSKVSVVELRNRILPDMQADIARSFQRILEQQGFVFKLGCRVISIDHSGPTLKILVELTDTAKTAETMEADVVMVCMGRVPDTQGLGLEALGVKTDPRGRIMTDIHGQTHVPGIFAIGDELDGPVIIQQADMEGIAVAEWLAAKNRTDKRRGGRTDLDRTGRRI